MFAAHTCERCGAKFRSNRDRCPRCRAVIFRPDPRALAATSRKLTRISAALFGVFLIALAVMWLRRDPGVDESKFATTAPAQTQAPAAAAAPGRPREEAVTPFLDVSGAASVSYRAGNYETALAQFEEAVRKNPNDAESLSNLGQVLVKLGRTAEAVPPLERATSLNPDRWAYRFNLARALGLLGRWDESIASYQRAQQLFPDDYVTTFNLGMAFHKAGRESDAVAQYRRAIELNPADPSFRIALAISYERLDKSSDAIASYTEYLRLSPSGAEAEQVRARIAVLSGAPPPAPAGNNAGVSNE